MIKECYYEMTEKVLNDFPIEYSRNYYENKKELTIEEQEITVNGVYGSYDNETNHIIIYLEESLPHELFHMAFRDKQKVRKRVWPDKEMYYSNGISFVSIYNGNEIFFQKGLTEGFAEYLNRKCCDDYGQHFNYFFVDLLISIYGEDILKYPLQNNPIEFLLDERFYDILSFSRNLDKLENAKTVIKIISYCKDTFYDIPKNGTKEDCTRVLKIIDDTKENFRLSIVSCFKNIIDEYESCENPIISREEFARKMELFLQDPNYKVAFALDDKKFSVQDKVTAIINHFKKDKSKLENMLWKIKSMTKDRK